MPLRETATIDDAIAFLNHLLKVDAEAIRALVETRVPCGEALTNHPTVQVQAHGSEPPSVGLLGLLNGLFGTEPDGGGPIAAVFDVVCPNCGKQEGRIDELCPQCGAKLVLGPLIQFQRRLV